MDVLSGELVSDRIGRSNTLYIIFTVITLALAVLAFVPG
ncbi:Oxalate/formate antiporter [Streptococcus macedonicus]|nr:Oxalate/formate antiporter [Streptococcus macedonicus]